MHDGRPKPLQRIDTPDAIDTLHSAMLVTGKENAACSCLLVGSAGVFEVETLDITNQGEVMRTYPNGIDPHCRNCFVDVGADITVDGFCSSTCREIFTASMPVNAESKEVI